MQDLKSFFDTVGFAFRNIGIADVIDIALVAFLIYKFINIVRSTSMARAGWGIILILVLTAVTDVAQLQVLNFLLAAVLELGFIALVIVFQPELRRVLERFGGKNLKEFIGGKEIPKGELEKAILATVSACEIMSRERVGVLLIFERESSLEDYFKTGTQIDAQTTEQLLRNLFFPKASLHDGAVIIRDGRIAAAGCILPNSSNPNISKELGTRHRAGIGMSEVSDAVVIVVSEETGSISVAVDGMLKRHLAHDTFEKILRNELMPEDEDSTGSRSSRIKIAQKIKGKKNDKANNN